MKQKIYIRADGSASIGLGHIVRCISLAYMLKNDFSIHFFSMEIPGSLKNEILQIGWDITEIANESDFLNQITGNEIILLDGYQFDSEYQKQIKKKGCKLACINDFHDQYFFADLVINHAPGITEDDYESEPYTRFLLGPDYSLLRPEFLDRKPIEKKCSTGPIKTIFVCFGGSDSRNLTAKILSWIPSGGYLVTVVLGNAFSHQKELNKVIDDRKDLEVIVKSSLSAIEMREELEQADLAIVPSSGILFEVISQGVPVISGYYVDNQLGIYNGFKELGCIMDARFFEKKDFLEVLEVIDFQIQNKIRQNQKKTIDGLSGSRIQKEFKKLIKVCV